MSYLTQSEILSELKTGTLGFIPALDVFQLQPHAIDLRLGFTFLIPRHWTLTQRGRIALEMDQLSGAATHFDTVELEAGQVFDLLPNESVLVSTLEKIKMPAYLVGEMFPRSSVNRRGLAVDLSGIVDAGYEGSLIIPVRNNSAFSVVRLYPGERFCQLTFTRLNTAATVRRSRYHQRDVAIGVLPEQDQEEVNLVRQGAIDELKATFRVKTEEAGND